MLNARALYFHEPAVLRDGLFYEIEQILFYRTNMIVLLNWTSSIKSNIFNRIIKLNENYLMEMTN